MGLYSRTAKMNKTSTVTEQNVKKKKKHVDKYEMGISLMCLFNSFNSELADNY